MATCLGYLVAGTRPTQRSSSLAIATNCVNVSAPQPVVLRVQTPLTNFLEGLAILLIAAALCHTFGRMVSDERQGWALLAAMTLLLLAMLVPAVRVETSPNPAFAAMGVDSAPSLVQPGGDCRRPRPFSTCSPG